MSIDPSGMDRRALLRRMAAGGLVAWSTPMLHSVASAQATASCGDGIVNWDNFAVNSLFTNTTVGTTTVSLAVSNITNTTVLTNNRRVLAGPAGGVNQRHLRFEMTPTNGSNANGSRQTITFTFSVPVTNVVFTFFDIDNVTNGWGDRIVMLTPGYTFLAPPGSTVIGTGTNGNRFRNSQTNNNLPPASGAGNLRITYPGPISSFQYIYRNEVNTGATNMLISMSDITFTC